MWNISALNHPNNAFVCWKAPRYRADARATRPSEPASTGFSRHGKLALRNRGPAHVGKVKKLIASNDTNCDNHLNDGAAVPSSDIWQSRGRVESVGLLGPNTYEMIWPSA
jgi:hypothetical protein